MVEWLIDFSGELVATLLRGCYTDKSVGYLLSTFGKNLKIHKIEKIQHYSMFFLILDFKILQNATIHSTC